MVRFLLIAVVLALTASAAANIQLYMHFNNTIDPSGNMPKIQDQVRVQDYNFSIENPAGVVEMRNASFKAFTFTRSIDLSSPGFFYKLVTGTKFLNAVLNVVNDAMIGGTATIATYTLSNVEVVGQAISGSLGAGIPLETVTLRFGSLTISDSGSTGNTFSYCWDAITNVAC